MYIVRMYAYIILRTLYHMSVLYTPCMYVCVRYIVPGVNHILSYVKISILYLSASAGWLVLYWFSLTSLGYFPSLKQRAAKQHTPALSLSLSPTHTHRQATALRAVSLVVRRQPPASSTNTHRVFRGYKPNSCACDRSCDHQIPPLYPIRYILHTKFLSYVYSS